MSAHTPGPWAVVPYVETAGGYDASVISPQGDAELGNWLIAGVRWDANARLIASAPRLAAALIGVVNGWERWYSELPRGAEDTEFSEFLEARLAIAEALGLADWRHAFPQHDPREAATVGGAR